MQQPNPSSEKRRQYEPPVLEHVVLDPIKEMLTACTTDPAAKNNTDCSLNINTNS